MTVDYSYLAPTRRKRGGLREGSQTPTLNIALVQLGVCQFDNLLYSIGVMADTIEILASSLTDTGRVRSVNQDTLCVYEPADSDTLSRSGRLFIVADGAGGVGGALAGKIASR